MAEDTNAGGVSRKATGIRAFLIADMRGYTRFSQQMGDEAAADLAARFAELSRRGVEAGGGALVELRGDEAVAVFASARAAVRASVELQRVFRQGDPEAALALPVGIGVDAGEGVPVGDGYRGRALNVAARLCSAADGGEILVTETVQRLAGTVEGADYARPRALSVKGVEEPVRLCQVVPTVVLPPLPPPISPRSRPRHRWVVAAASAIVATLLAGLWLATRSSGGSALISPKANSVVVIDPARHTVVGDIPLGTPAGELVAGSRAIWVGEDNRESIARIDPVTRETRTVGVGVDPQRIAVGFGRIWMYDSASNQAAYIDGRLREGVESFPPPHVCSSGCPGGLAFGHGHVWLAQGLPNGPALLHYGQLWELAPGSVHPSSVRVTRSIRQVPADRLTFGGGRVWAYGEYGFRVAQVDPVTAQVRGFRLPDVSAVYNTPGLAYGFGHAWVVAPQGVVFGLSLDGLQRTTQVPEGAYDIAAGGRSLWITYQGGTLIQIDAYTQTITRTYRLGYAAYGVAYADGRVWVGLGARIHT